MFVGRICSNPITVTHLCIARGLAFFSTINVATSICCRQIFQLFIVVIGRGRGRWNGKRIDDRTSQLCPNDTPRFIHPHDHTPCQPTQLLLSKKDPKQLIVQQLRPCWDSINVRFLKSVMESSQGRRYQARGMGFTIRCRIVY